MPNSKFLDLND